MPRSVLSIVIFATQAEWSTTTPPTMSVLEAFLELSKTEGIIPALESTHAVAYVIKHAREMSRDQIVMINLSGRGDKDVQQVAQFIAAQGEPGSVADEIPRGSRLIRPGCDSNRLSVIEIPTEVPVMALSNAVLFPHSLLPLHIFEPRYRDLLAHCLDGDRMFSIALMRRGIDEASGLEDLCPVAGVGLIRACVGNENGTSNLVLQGLARVRLVHLTQEELVSGSEDRARQIDSRKPRRGRRAEREGERVLYADRTNRRSAASESHGSFEAD